MEPSDKRSDSAGPAPAPASPTDPGHKARILVAEDHPASREYLQTVLGYAGYEVLEAADGKEALSAAHSHRPDLIITDILLPKLDGLELVRRIRSDPDIARTRVIVWSASLRREETQDMTVSLDVAHFLQKPVEPATLLATVEEILRTPPPPRVPASVLGRLEETHQQLLNDQLYKKALELDEAIGARQQVEAMLRENQRRFGGVIESALDAIISIDAEQRIILFNAAAESLFRCPAQEAIGSSIERFIPERFRASHAEYVRQFAASDFPAHSMGQRKLIWGLRTDGEEFPIEASMSKVYAEGLWQLTLILRDITERQRAEDALRDSERRLALALEAGRSAVWELDVATGMVRHISQLAAMLGYGSGQLAVLADWMELVHEDDRPDFFATMNEFIQSKDAEYRREMRLRARDGTWRWLLVQAVTAERDARGKASRVVGTATDITTRKEAELGLQRLNSELEQRVQERTAELIRANDALLHSNMELQHFAHATAHDLQTPLRSIAGFAQLLHQAVQGSGDEQIKGWCSLIINNTARLQMLIRQLLNYTRLDAQGLPFEAVDLRAVVNEATSSLAVLIQETGAEVLAPEPLPVLSVDRTQMAQLLQNLIENGIKYNQSTLPRVTIACELHEDKWVFAVADNGIGIDPRHHERIFEIFRRLHTYSQVPGTGIGLALCRRIVERHGGHIWVESRPGSGSTFYFTLPNRREGD